MKITNTPQIEMYIYNEYFEKLVSALVKKYKVVLLIHDDEKKQNNNVAAAAAATPILLKKADLIRLENTYRHIAEQKANIFEYLLLELLENLLKKKTQRLALLLFYDS